MTAAQWSRVRQLLLSNYLHSLVRCYATRPAQTLTCCWNSDFGAQIVVCLPTSSLALLVLFLLFLLSKDKSHPVKRHDWYRGSGDAEVWLYLCFVLAVKEGVWSPSLPGSFTPRKKSRYPLWRRLCGPQDFSGWIWSKGKPVSPREFHAPTLQHPASGVTGYVFPASICVKHWLRRCKHKFFMRL